MGILLELTYKRASSELSKQDIQTVVDLMCDESYSEDEKAKFLFSVMEKDLSPEETTHLTMSMAHSGKILSFDGENGKFVDKHSTGGISDTTTIILMPLLACFGLKSVKMSGRSLGHTGGTADKLECIEGYKTGLNDVQAKEVCGKCGVAMITQSKDIAVADKIIYALRDKIGAVGSVSLIASSIMSKKIASGANYILLDVKTGNGGLMQSLEDSQRLAKLMVDIGKSCGKQTRAIITDMNQPLGQNVGDELELDEAVEVLSGRKQSGRLFDLCVRLGAEMLLLTKKSFFLPLAKLRVKMMLKSKKPFEKFKKVVELQGGTFNEEQIARFENAEMRNIYAKSSGYVQKIHAKEIGQIVHSMRAEIGCGAGIKMRTEIGKFVREGDVVMRVCKGTEAYDDKLLSTIELGDKLVLSPKLVYEVIK